MRPTEITTIEDPMIFIAVCEELMDPQWYFRTVDGIARSIGYPAEEVESFLIEHGWLVRWLPALTTDEQQLLVWSGKKHTWLERKIRIRAALAKDILYVRSA